ncbi:MAG: TolC family protein [Planctomycetes bacterium]|nr:TolC family protein [Planctomycetota bacterium]
MLIVPGAAESHVIDLPSAIRLAEVTNPNLGMSRAALSEAMAIHRSTRVLLLPDLNAGANYDTHHGPYQASPGHIFDVDRQSVYVGGGARTLAAETLGIPMVRIFAHLGDAYFLPLAARQEVAARGAENQAVTNEVLLDVVTRYLELAAAESRIDAWRKSLGEIDEIRRNTQSFARTGQGREGDFQRATGDALLMRVESLDAEAEAMIASNELARLLRLDPAIHLTTMQAPLELVELVDPVRTPEELAEMAARLRPEIRAQSAMIGAAQARYRLERTRPLLPTVMVGYSAGGFGGGSNRSDLKSDVEAFQRFGGRSDFDMWAYWTLQNFGAGNVALQNQRSADRTEAVARRTVTQFNIRREVIATFAALQAAKQRLDVVARQLESAQRGAKEELIRTRLGEGLPIESLNSITRLAKARQDAIGAVVDYDLAQFRLFVAVGSRPSSAGPNPAPLEEAAIGSRP